MRIMFSRLKIKKIEILNFKKLKILNFMFLGYGVYIPQ